MKLYIFFPIFEQATTEYQGVYELKKFVMDHKTLRDLHKMLG